MNDNLNYRRGEIVYVDFSPIVGSEQAGIRPAVIIQNDVGNKYSLTTIVLPITSKVKKKLPTHVLLHSGSYSLPKNSIILAEQVRTIDKKRIIKKVGIVDDITLNQIRRALEISFEIRMNIFEIIDQI